MAAIYRRHGKAQLAEKMLLTALRMAEMVNPNPDRQSDFETKILCQLGELYSEESDAA
jgi:hypothetical protein